MSFSGADVEGMCAAWPAGKRVRLVSTTDPYTNKRGGELGSVALVDSLGTVHVNWDDGSTLGLIPGVDRWEAA